MPISRQTPEADALIPDPTGLRPLAPIRALMSMPCANVGVGGTCRSILRGAVTTGFAADLHTSRDDGPRNEPFVLSCAIPRALRWLPYKLAQGFTDPRLHRDYLDSVKPGDVAYLWPSVPLAVFAEARRRGNPVVTESINTLMRHAKPVLDAEYLRLGLRPAHSITDARIADEEARLHLTDAILSPSPATDAVLSRSAFADRTVAASYGTWVGHTAPPERVRGPRVTFLFVGLASIRKGLQDLLDAWRDVPRSAHLRIVGAVDYNLLRLYADVFAQSNVSVAGYATNVDREYRAADVFVLPSLEEGDPIVTYEAAARGLPLLVSAQGAGRIGAAGAATLINSRDIALLRHWIETFAGSHDLRLALGARAWTAVQEYDWPLVAKRRLDDLGRFLAAPPQTGSR